MTHPTSMVVTITETRRVLRLSASHLSEQHTRTTLLPLVMLTLKTRLAQDQPGTQPFGSWSTLLDRGCKDLLRHCRFFPHMVLLS